MEFHSHIEISVSLRGKPFFSTSPSSALDERKAGAIYKELYTRFPEGDGFKITVTRRKMEARDLTRELYSEIFLEHCSKCQGRGQVDIGDGVTSCLTCRGSGYASLKI